MVRRILWLAFVLVASAGPLPGHATPLGLYQIVTLGLTDAAHTRSDGYRFSWADDLNDAGLAVGYSERYSGASQNGYSAWLYDSGAATTTRVGFFDADHTASDGYQASFVSKLSGSTLAVGNSDRYSGASYMGSSAWLYDSATATTTRVGFFDADHTGSDGFQGSFVDQLNDSGLAAGYSDRFTAESWFGYSAWLYDSTAATTTRVGFFDADHTASDGYQESFVNVLNDSTLAAGTSARFSGDDAMGYSAWLYDSAAATTTRVGFFDADHIRSDGYQTSFTDFLNDSGLAAGSSERFSGASAMGNSAWLYDSGAATTTRVGFFDTDHTRSDGYQASWVGHLNDAGLAAGSSERFSGASAMGTSAWLYDSAADTTTRIGFVDAVHTRSDGYQDSFVNVLNDAQLAAGTSARFGGASFLGSSAWLYDGAAATTTRVGLFDATHTRSDGYQESNVDFVAAAGLAAGSSERFSGASWNGTSAWIYDAATETHYSIILSTRSDGFASSFVSFLGEDGLVLGAYELFDGLDNALGFRAFAWTVSDGAVDLGALVNGGLAAAGWSHLADVVRADGLGQILGFGSRTNGNDLPYLLVPVPEPGTRLLLALGLGAFALARIGRPCAEQRSGR